MFVAFYSFSMVFTLTSALEVKVKPGEDVLLQCRTSRAAAFRLIKWIRPDLKSGGFVFFIRETRTYEDFQHLFFHGRVKLRDPQMKDGDISVILKNVKINDTGTYECYVANTRRNTQVISSITLTVTGGDKDEEEADGNNRGHVGLTVSLSVVAVLLVAAVVGFVIYRKRGIKLS